ncbi:MAG TPA: hypothetical protein DCY79_17340 [Planctomycetaceae bacterium]|nr:hypothetical protein [Blastopirellula sp.]HAY81570.1 hypothetical protein [Planctomycetaceae bacterium]
MTELIKTLIYAGVAVVVFVIAYIARPTNEEFQPKGEIGKLLFPTLDDVSKADRLKIVRYSQDRGELDEIEVAKDVSGLWVLPSHNDYPADAETQTRDVAMELLDLKILDVASELPQDHDYLGVLEPTEDSSGSGFGTLVELKDKSDSELAGLIIGRAVQGSETQRFVRRIGKDEVYVIEIDPTKFSTKFEDWINTDLLEVNAMDIEAVTIDDHSVIPSQGPLGQIQYALENRSKMELLFSDNKWLPGPMTKFVRNEPQPMLLEETEELDQETLNDLKTALGEVKIVDVREKPEGVSESLKAGEALNDPSDQLRGNLQRIGIFPVAGGEVKSANGEVRVGLKTGVEYVLRFGHVTGLEEDSDEGKLNRFLFLMAQVNENLLEQPVLEELPELPAGADGPAAGDKPEAGAEAEAKPAVDQDEALVQIKKERERIEQENQKKLDDYNDKLEKAKIDVLEINARFAKWYYVISEDVYKRVRPGYGDIVAENDEAKREGFGVDAFRSLEEEGIEKPAVVEEPAVPAVPGLPLSQ